MKIRFFSYLLFNCCTLILPLKCCLFSSSNNSLQDNYDQKHILVIAFDYGGVIAQKFTAEPFYNFLKETFNLNSEELTEILTKFKKPENRCENKLQFYQKLAHEKNIVLPEDFLEKVECAQLAGLKTNYEMISLVKNLKKNGYKVVCFSNVYKQTADIIRQSGLYDIFDDCILGYEIGYHKPDPKSYDCLLAKIKVLPQECLFIDDKEENINAARLKGINAVRFNSIEDLNKSLKSYQINFQDRLGNLEG